MLHVMLHVMLNVMAHIKTHFDIHGMLKQIFRVILVINQLNAQNLAL